MATPHIAAQSGEIASKILLPGDPLRAKHIAETYLEKVVQFNAVRNMLGYTGEYKGEKISVMGTGMGAPSIGIYSYELIHFYGVKQLIRVGSMGAIQPQLKIGDVVVAQGAGTDSNFAKQYNLPGIICAIPSATLMIQCMLKAKELNIPIQVGSIVSSDIFYASNPDEWKKWSSMNVLGLEMECYALYLTAMHAKVHALTLCTVSDSLLFKESMNAEQRQNSLDSMVTLALEVLL